MRPNNLLRIAAMAMLLTGCGKDSGKGDNAADAIRYKYYNLEKNGWKSRSHTQSLGDINYTATEVPLQFYLVKEMGVDNLISTDSIFKENERERILEFEFLSSEERDLLDQKYTSLPYEESVKYMSFKIQDDFYVVTQKSDTIKCCGVLYERRFKVAPSERLLLFFSGIDPKDQIQLVYNDRLFNKGTIKFRFKEKLTPFIL